MNVIKEFYTLRYNGTDIMCAYFICKEKTVILSRNAITLEEKDDAATQGLMLMMELAFYSLKASKEEQLTINNILYPFNLLSRAFIVYAVSNAVIYKDEDKDTRYKRSTKFVDVSLKEVQKIAHLLEEKNNE